MRLSASAAAVGLAAMLALGGCTSDSEQADARDVSWTTAVSASASEAVVTAFGHRSKPYASIPCPQPGRRKLLDAWYDAAKMRTNCIGWKLQRQSDAQECRFTLLSDQQDSEAVLSVIRSWGQVITASSVGSESLWGSVPVHFEGCEMYSATTERRAERDRMDRQREERNRKHCAALREAVDSAWRRWADHSAYDSRTEDDRLYRQYRSAQDALDRSRC